jgi:hypothetical protein
MLTTKSLKDQAGNLKDALVASAASPLVKSHWRKAARTLLFLFWCVSPAAGWAEPIQVEATAKPGEEWKPMPTQTLNTLAAAAAMPTDADLSVYGGQKNRKEKATGFFHTARVNGRWWLVDPEGCLFLNKGLCSVATIPTPGAQAALKQKFGSPDKWARDTTDLIRDYGFNGFGAWSDTARLRAVAHPVVYTRIWNFMSAYGERRGGTYHANSSLRLHYSGDAGKEGHAEAIPPEPA